MQQIKIFHEYLEGKEGPKAYEKYEKTVNTWLGENKNIRIKNIFSANMSDDDGDGHLILVVVWEDAQEIRLS